MSRIRRAAALAAFATLLCLSGMARADYPDRPVRLQVVVAPGASVDALARLVANKNSRRNGIRMSSSRTGRVPTARWPRSTWRIRHPDGTALLFTYNALTVTPNTHKLRYDPIKSFIPIVLVASTPTVLAVNPSALPVNTLGELITYVKANPGKLSFGSGGTGGPLYSCTWPC